MTGRHRCPCCGYRTLSREIGWGDTCPVCYWEANSVESWDPLSVGGGNGLVSLAQARRTYLATGAMDLRFRGNVRPPREDEIPGVLGDRGSLSPGEIRERVRHHRAWFAERRLQRQAGREQHEQRVQARRQQAMESARLEGPEALARLLRHRRWEDEALRRNQSLDAGREAVRQACGDRFDQLRVLLCLHDPLDIDTRAFPGRWTAYDSQVEGILVRFWSEPSVDDVRGMIFDEFSSWFVPDVAGPASRYNAPAEDLWQLLRGPESE